MKKVFINGVFDILHPGHIKLLNAAYIKFPNEEIQIIVAIDTDDRVAATKGWNRPINSEKTRYTILKNLKQVDTVVSFNTDQELITLIKNYQPDLMVKGSDYKNKPIIGAEYCKEILFVDLTNDSTTKTIERISNR